MMFGVNRLEIAGTFAASLYWLASEMLNPILSLYVSSINVITPIGLSLILASQTFVPFLITIPIGSLSDRLGHNRILVSGAVFMVAGSLLFLTAHVLWVFILSQVLVGVGQIAVWLSAQSIITFVNRANQLDKSISRMSFFTACGQLTGPILGGWVYYHHGFATTIWLYIAIALTIFLAIPLQGRARKYLVNTERVSFGQFTQKSFSVYEDGGNLYKENKGVRVSTYISFSLAFILFIRVTYLPLYLKHLQYSAMHIGVFIGLWSFASIVIRPFAPALIQRVGRWHTTFISLLLSLCGLIGLTFFSSNFGLACVLILLGFGTGLNQPLAISLVSVHTMKETRGLAMGIRLMANRCANWLCPISMGVLNRFFGMSLTFTLISVPLCFISYLSLRELSKLLHKVGNDESVNVHIST